MYKYQFRVLELGYGQKELLIEFEDKGKEILSTFLESDVSAFKNYVFEAIGKVLSGNSEYEELNGNVCGVEINKDMTQIYDNLAEDGMGNWCEIETQELRELVDIWCNELKRFKEQQK
ncbi:hypothetical protein [Clostridium butyricum]|uniref:Antitoxin n=1 Tax=Clostridium butyricum TaxID=1492 RepID=A0AAP9UGP8_CLOBU|nr:hypothetical protein [Clostridium butyricum]MBZ5747897.1 hypothetical protein [Clostridium butyricum]QMW93326.1 hypothetical protein FF104_20735 [Clostridium butyricum]BBK78778.1 antitoxin [Clostridium butyricum]GEQ24994.1 antitoxin [Clostridium butyricum]